MQLSTGGGKTVIFTKIALETINRGNSVLVVTDRKELLTQAGGTFEKFGIKPEMLTANTRELSDSKIYIAMVETLKRRLDKKDYQEFLQKFNLIILDEAHKQAFTKLFESISLFQYVIGATATPYRTGKMRELKKDYDSIVTGPQINELIDQGYLSPAIHYGVPINGLDKVKITGGEFDQKQMGALYMDTTLYDGVIANYKAHCYGKKALLFCATVENSLKMVDQMESAGIECRHIDAETPKQLRDETLREFKEGRFQVLSNVGILTTGYDEPSIEVVIVYRATRSLPLWLQMCGRGSRIYEGKNQFVILDFGENTKRHGFWDDSRGWSLDNAKPPKKKGVQGVKECKACGALIPVNAKICRYCGHEIEIKRKEKTDVEVMLEKMSPSQVNSTRWESVHELEEVRKKMNYLTGWVLYRLKTLDEYKQYAQLKGYRRGWAEINYKKKWKN